MKITPLKILFTILHLTAASLESSDQTRETGSAPPEVLQIRWANFAGLEDITITYLETSINLKSRMVSGYSEIPRPDPGNFLSISVNQKALLLSLDSLSFPLALVLVYFDSQYTLKLYPDTTFESSNTTVSHLYDTNFFWRMILIPPNAVDYDLFELNHACEECGFTKAMGNLSTSYVLDCATEPKSIMISYTQNEQVVNKTISRRQTFSSMGLYTLFYLYNTEEAVLVEDEKPEPFYSPLILVLIYIFGLGFFRVLWLARNRQRGRKFYRASRSIKMKSAAEEDIKYVRLPYVDTMRGIAILVLVFCKSGGGFYSFFTESLWDGFTFADLPEYLLSWIMGFCIPFNYRNTGRQRFSLWKNLVAGLARGFVVLVVGRTE